MRIHILLFILILTACSRPSDKITINGTISGEITKTIRYTSPINGICNRLFTESLSLDSLGNFSVSAYAEKPMIVEFLIGKNINRLLIEPGKSYKLDIKIALDKIDFRVVNATKAQAYYNTLPKLSPRRCVFSFGDDISNYEKISNQLDITHNNELSDLKNLMNNKYISAELSQLIKQDRNVYYQTAQSILAAKNIFDFEKNKETVPNSLVKLRENAIKQIDLTSSLSLQACDIYDFIYMYKWYNLRNTFPSDELKEVRATHRREGTIHTHSINMAKQFLPQECQEFYIASYITYYSRSLKKEKEFLEIMEQYKLDYPNSQYLCFFKDNIEKISALLAVQK